MKLDKQIYVTQPVLPPLHDFIPYLKEIWDSKILTNGGPFHERLEKALCAFLGVRHIALFTNCTIGLVTALQALQITGEVITTPYTFAATPHSLLWNRLTPVFVDIDPQTLNLDPAKIEAAITPLTTAIMPTHCYGQPCDVISIEKIAKKHGLKVIYDAAHAFGVRIKSESILNYGDLSVLSFHATKVFNTFEGGAIICPDARTKLHIDQLKNFGFVDEVTVVSAGINGKMSEFNAALGLLQLDGIEQALHRRGQIDARYRHALEGVKGISFLHQAKDVVRNYAYFPIFVRPEFRLNRDQLYFKMQEKCIYTRRYFFPLVSNFEMYQENSSAEPKNLPAANLAASQVICLPIYPNLLDEEVDEIVDVIAAESNR